MQCLVLHSCKAVPGFVHLKRNTFTALKCTRRSTPATQAVGQATSGGSDAGNRATQQQEYVAAAIDTLAGIIDAKIEASRRVSTTTLILSMLGFGFLVCVGLASFPKGLAVAAKVFESLGWKEAPTVLEGVSVLLSGIIGLAGLVSTFAQLVTGLGRIQEEVAGIKLQLLSVRQQLAADKAELREQMAADKAELREQMAAVNTSLSALVQKAYDDRLTRVEASLTRRVWGIF